MTPGIFTISWDPNGLRFLTLFTVIIKIMDKVDAPFTVYQILSDEVNNPPLFKDVKELVY